MLSHFTLVFATFFILNACLASPDANQRPETGQVPLKSSATTPAHVAYQQVEWPELMPAEDLEALSNPPEYIVNIEDGSIEDQIGNQLKGAMESASDDRYQQALVSANVVSGMNNRNIRIPGFIVPLEFDDDQSITRFFLVPFFGACIHVPPPPPNQIILVDYPDGFKVSVLYDPVWISGKLKTTLTENDVAKSAYSMNMDKIEPYRE